MARPGDHRYREQRNKDFDCYYRRAKNKKSLPVQSWLARLLHRLLTACGTRVIGAENIPEHGPYILAPSHSSVVDPFFFSFLARRQPLRFVAKSQIFTTMLGPLVLALGAFPIRRGHYDQQAFDLCQQLLEDGQRVLLFPQGGTQHQLEASAARWGVGLVAQRSGVPIVPVLIVHRHLFSHQIICGPALRFPVDSNPSRQDNQTTAEEIMAALIALQKSR